MLQNTLEFSEMLQNTLEFFEMLQNTLEYSEMLLPGDGPDHPLALHRTGSWWSDGGLNNHDDVDEARQ